MNNTFQDVNAFDDGFQPMSGGSPDGLGMPLGLGLEQQPAPVLTDSGSTFKRTLAVGWAIAGVAGAGIGAYHGYKRNNSVGWAIVWSLLGSLAPVVVIPVAFAQGIGKRAGR